MDLLLSFFEQFQLLVAQRNVFDLFLLFLLVYIGLIWLGLIIWTVIDATRRSRNILFLMVAFLLTATLNIFGVLIYVLIRPPQPLSQRVLEERELEHFSELFLCPQCDGPIKEEYKFCPHCNEKIRKPCSKCKRLIDKTWQVCAYCGMKIKPQT